MKEEEIIDFMLDSFNDTFRTMCKRAQLPDDQIEEMIVKNHESTLYVVVNLYSKMKNKNLLNLL